jgi:hypothetical protein
MNIWGKVLAFLIILLGVGAFILSTQLLDFRSTWMKQYETNRKRLIDVRASVATKKRELAELQANYERLMLGWDLIDSNKAAVVTAPDTLQINTDPRLIAESKDKEGKSVMPVIYAFKPGADGKYQYVGEFRAEKLGAAMSMFRATTPLPDDATVMQPGQGWRIRTRIPNSHKLSFAEFSRKFNLLQETSLAKADELKALTEEITPRIATNLANREKQVSGNAALKGQRGKLPNVLIDGELPTLALMEEARNAKIAEADDLRHKLKAAVIEFETLQTANGKAANQFLKPEETVKPAVSKR